MRLNIPANYQIISVAWPRLLFPRRFLAFLILSIIFAACAPSASVRNKAEKTDIERSHSADIYMKLGFEYMGRGQNEIALKNFKRALQFDDKSTDAHQAIAVFYQQLDQLDLAAYHFKRAVELQPSNARAHNNYGKLLCSEGEFEKAQEHLKFAYTESSNVRSWIALANAGQCARLEGDIDAAESYLRQALKKNQAYVPALLGMAEISFNNKKYLSARGFLQRYFDIADYTPKALRLAVLTENQLGSRETAESFMTLLRKRFPSSDETTKLKQRFPEY